MVDQKTLDAFQQMWGPFPEPVLLVYKDRTILATNDLAREVGVPVGVKCFSLNPEAVTKACPQCKANVALKEKRTVCSEEDYSGTTVIGYWMPLKENPEVYVHFGVGNAKLRGIQVNTAPYLTEKTPLVNVGDAN